MAASKQACTLQTHFHNAVLLVWSSLRLAPITVAFYLALCWKPPPRDRGKQRSGSKTLIDLLWAPLQQNDSMFKFFWLHCVLPLPSWQPHTMALCSCESSHPWMYPAPQWHSTHHTPPAGEEGEEQHCLGHHSVIHNWKPEWSNLASYPGSSPYAESGWHMGRSLGTRLV